MNLGWLDVCLRVADVATSRKFYEGLGFKRVEGDDDEGWAVVVNGESRLGLFSATFMGEDAFSLNFRGGDVIANGAALAAAGYTFESEPAPGKFGGGSAKLRDPDGNLIFLDTAPNETKLT